MSRGSIFSHLTTIQKRVVVGFAVVLCAVMSLLIFSSGTTHAAVGGGGGGSGGGGGHQATYGYGWYNYDVNGGGPSDGFRDGTSWAFVQQQCSGALRVIAFVVLDRRGTHMVYRWEGWNNPSRLQSGGDWISIPTASSFYDTVPANEKVGFTWGSNVAWFCYGDASKEWNVSGGSRIQKGNANEAAAVYGTITAAPGERLNWYHHLYNSGPEDMDKQIYYNVGKSGFQYGWDGTVDPQGWTSGNAGSVFVRHYPGAPYTLYDVTQNDVGNTVCQFIRWTDLAWNNPTDGVASPPACAYVPYNFRLIPEITNISDGQMTESAAGPINVQGRVTNTGPTKTTPNIQWQLTQVKYRPGVGIPNSGGGTSPNDPCRYFTGNLTCTNLGSGNEAGGFGQNATATYGGTGNLADEPVGTRLCFAMSVVRVSSATTDWGHSRLYCMVVGKKPKVQVYGGDLIVGRGYNSAGAKVNSGVTTSISNKGGTYYGSWGEYAIIPSGRIVGMASASGYAVGVGTNNLCTIATPLSLLSLSNANKPSAAPAVCNPSNIGNYQLTSASQYDAIAARFAAPAGAPTVTGNVHVSNLAARTIYRGTGTINLSSTPSAAVTPMPAGKWVIINAPDADVRITSNLTYTDGALARTADIPQLVIIARNIVIAEGVGRVDAWLFAKGSGSNGTVNTCDANDPAIVEPSQLTSGICAGQLVINGPVISNHLLLHRTYGSGVGPDSGTPAEIFNLRPDAYMWASAFSGVGTKARTVITTELPPRF